MRILCPTQGNLTKREVFGQAFFKRAPCAGGTQIRRRPERERRRGGWGRGAPVAHELAPTEPAGETQSPINRAKPQRRQKKERSDFFRTFTAKQKAEC
ncbi:hypothetical protein B5F35_01935 [Anaeromassilibacillus sp. An200]|nr:hypothetical protein B5F35_01935 [Anaeromassilibacillus sp. An200]